MEITKPRKITLNDFTKVELLEIKSALEKLLERYNFGKKMKCTLCDIAYKKEMNSEIKFAPTGNLSCSYCIWVAMLDDDTIEKYGKDSRFDSCIAWAMDKFNTSIFSSPSEELRQRRIKDINEWIEQINYRLEKEE